MEINCVKICPIEFFPLEKEKEKICEKCDYKCESCHSEKICLSCKDGFLHNPYTKECKDYCDKGFIPFEDKKFKNNIICEKCDSKCNTCEGSLENCTSCKDSFLLKEKKICLNECPIGMYNDNVWNTCELCHNTCKTCLGHREKDCLSCKENTELKLIFGYCSEGCPGSTVMEIGGMRCLDIKKDCFSSIFLSLPKIFSITDRDFVAELVYIVNENCYNYQKDFEFKWDHLENAVIDGNKIKISSDKLEEGNLNLGVSIGYNNLEFVKIKGESNLVKYKVKIYSIKIKKLKKF